MARGADGSAAVNRDAVANLAPQRLGMPELAKERGNVAEAWRRSPDQISFQEWKRRFQTQGFKGLRGRARGSSR